MPGQKLKEVKAKCDPFCCYPCVPCGLHIKKAVLPAAIYFVIVAIIWLVIAYMLYSTFTNDPSPPNGKTPDWKYQTFTEVQNTIYIEGVLATVYLLLALILLAGIVTKNIVMVTVFLGGFIVIHVIGLLVFATQSMLLCSWQRSCEEQKLGSCYTLEQSALMQEGKNICYTWEYLMFYIHYILELLVSWYPFWVCYVYYVWATRSSWFNCKCCPVKPRWQSAGPDDFVQPTENLDEEVDELGDDGEDWGLDDEAEGNLDEEAGGGVMVGGKGRGKGWGRGRGKGARGGKGGGQNVHYRVDFQDAEGGDDDDYDLPYADDDTEGGPDGVGGKGRGRGRGRGKGRGLLAGSRLSQVGPSDGRASIGGGRRTSKIVRRTITRRIIKHRPGEEDEVHVVKFSYNPSEVNKRVERRMSRYYEDV